MWFGGLVWSRQGLVTRVICCFLYEVVLDGCPSKASVPQPTSFTGTIWGTGTTRVRATLLTVTLETPGFGKGFHRHCREAAALFYRHYKTTMWVDGLVLTHQGLVRRVIYWFSMKRSSTVVRHASRVPSTDIFQIVLPPP